jgi:hypothetical protein
MLEKCAVTDTTDVDISRYRHILYISITVMRITNFFAVVDTVDIDIYHFGQAKDQNVNVYITNGDNCTNILAVMDKIH